MEFTGLILLLGLVLMLTAEELAGYSIRRLMERYQRQKENPVAFELLQRYRESEHAQQGEILWALLAPHQEDLAKIVASMRGDPQEELQKLFLKLHKLFMQGKFPATNWKYWLARIIKNDMLNQFKRKNPFVATPLEELNLASESPEGSPYNLAQVQSAIQGLTDTQRRVIELRYLKREDKLMTYKEIASVMNCSVGQVHGYLDRAKENLRTQLGVGNS